MNQFYFFFRVSAIDGIGSNKKFLDFLRKKSKRETKLYKFLISILNVKRFIFIDDARHTGTLRLACKDKEIQTTAYQHATIEEFHVGLMGESFDNYLVWNEFFKNYLTEINTDYKRKNIVICGHPRIKITEGHKNLKPDNIIFLEETNFNFEEALPYMQLVSDRFNIIYRKKPGLRSKDYFFNS